MHPENTAEQAGHGDPAYEAYARAFGGLLDEYGVAASSSFVEVGPAGRIFVTRVGAGKPVVFLHGTPATSAVWIPLVARLRGVQAYLVDRPGHGLSDAFDYSELTDLRSHAVDFVEGLLDALGLDQAVVAGNSLGGLWALWTAADRPSRVSAVIQVGAPPGLLSPRLPRIFGPLSVPWMAKLMRRLDPPSPGATRRFFKHMGDPPALLNDKLIQAFTEAQRLPNAEGGMAHLVQRFVEWPGRFTDRRLWLDFTDLAEIRQPVLFLWGAHDFLGDLTFAQRVVTALPNATLIPAGTGHLPWLQDPAAVAAAIQSFSAN
ncbi:pimeloyl-ACP methyl ester carboxylesterase [Kribbella sp. VKM Ac-2527]|uniref:Pimeloyl-ACP methyl ester carboxylesterase n=1 Tax=Kribbella caucasensis TaxID=2512215 RepID=A0A4R6J6B3_9ACTN|nr:alpha/beta hydrolase [Kribbella sp. VKM Ac-2527]TDO29815.1 pimeloyl-ACP methyl ester carboxylesterase [Kribbella sp. VKM Ac-2527]